MKFIVSVLLTVFLLGCATGTPVPKTLDQQLYSAYGLYVVLANTTADMVETGTLSPEQGKKVQSRLAEIRPRLETFRTLLATSPATPGGLEGMKALHMLLLEIQYELQMEAAEHE